MDSEKIMERMMSEGYLLLVDNKTKWPKRFTVDMKRKLYNKVMTYYTTTENFEYCTNLSQSLNNIKDETNN